MLCYGWIVLDTEHRELPLARLGTEICARGMHGVKYSHLEAVDVLDR